MISLEQIRTLETKVHKAVSMLTAVQEENQLLRSKLGTYENRIEELEFMIEEFKEDQSEIEQGIISALNHLDHLEDAVGGLKGQAVAQNSSTEAATAEEPTSEEVAVEQEAAAPLTKTASAPTWEPEAKQFEQPSPAEFEPIEEVSLEAEVEEQPARNQQLDIF